MINFVKELLEVVNVWLGDIQNSSPNNDIRVMLIKNDVKTYDNFLGMTY